MDHFFRVRGEFCNEFCNGLCYGNYVVKIWGGNLGDFWRSLYIRTSVLQGKTTSLLNPEKRKKTVFLFSGWSRNNWQDFHGFLFSSSSSDLCTFFAPFFAAEMKWTLFSTVTCMNPHPWYRKKTQLQLISLFEHESKCWASEHPIHSEFYRICMCLVLVGVYTGLSVCACVFPCSVLTC